MTKISKMIDSITGKTEEELRLKEQLKLLQTMAIAKSQVLENDLKLMLADKEAVGSLEIIGDKAFEYDSSQHVNVTEQCDDAVMDAIDEFFKGSRAVKEGFQRLVKQGLSGLIGNASVGEVEDGMTFVYPENYSIVRVDVRVWKYTFSSDDALAKGVKNVLAYTMAKSTVDHTKVGVDYLMYTVVGMLRGDSDEDPHIEEILPFIKSLQECWKALDEGAVS